MPISGDERDVRAIIGAVASLGAGLDMIVVAEGIETEEQMKLVTTQGLPRRPGLSVRPPNERGGHPRAARNAGHLGADGRLTASEQRLNSRIAKGAGVIARTRASLYPFALNDEHGPCGV